MSKLPLVLVPVLLLAGCPDPEKQFPENATTAPTTPGADPTAAPPPMQDPGAGGMTPGAPAVPTFQVEPGSGVKLSGSFNYDGATKGNLRIDIFRPGADGRPLILHALTLDKTGDWEVEAPKDTGEVIILGFVDANGNGPEMAEPSGFIDKVTIADKPVTGLAINIKDGAKNDWAVDSVNRPPPGGATSMPDPGAGNQPPPDGAAAAPPADGAAPAAAPADGAAAPAAPAAAPATP